jgi:hypothetical protein
MTEYETGSLFIQYLGAYQQVLFGFISFLFAFLVMSYVAAEKPTGWLSFISLALADRVRQSDPCRCAV